MDIRLTFAIFVGKLIALVIRLKGGGATAAPGLAALKIDPGLVKKLSKKIKNGSILISGTNGKTTTSRLIADILCEKYKIIHNRQGSNLLRGIASTLISHANFWGNLQNELAIWEVDEAIIPEVLDNVSPKIVVLLNLFRDQLDRYGEVDTIRAKWQKTLLTLSKNTILILNADDPGISFLEKSFNGKVIFFGVNDINLKLPEIAAVFDIKHCLNCNAPLSYSTLLSAHLGHYHCPKCKLKRPSPQISAQNLIFNEDFSTQIDLTFNSPQPRQAKRGGQLSTLNYNLPGLYNAYNILAAIAIANILKINLLHIKKKIQSFSAAFGRFQKIKVDDKEIVTFLIKNPAGANEVLRTISLKNNLNLLVILNDKIADGKDVSWIWDTHWETLNTKTEKIFVSGIRTWDMALRLKYADFRLNNNNIHKNINYSIKTALKNMNNKSTLIILPTYTALLTVQKSLNKIGESTKWQKQ